MSARLLSFSVSYPISATSDCLWEVIGDFGNEHVWTETLVRCVRDTPDVRVGTVRRCRLARPLMGRSEVEEVVVALEPGRFLRYELRGGAGPFASAASRWALQERPGRMVVVTVEGFFRPRHVAVLLVWPFAKRYLRLVTRQVLRELESFVLAGGAASGRAASGI